MAESCQPWVEEAGGNGLEVTEDFAASDIYGMSSFLVAFSLPLLLANSPRSLGE